MPSRKLKRNEVTIAQQGRKLVGGRRVDSGDRSDKFEAYCKNVLGITKEEFLKKKELAAGERLSEKVLARAQGLDEWQEYIGGIIGYYNATRAKGITLQEDAYLLESDLINYRMKKMATEPDWDPITDKWYQNAQERKAQLLGRLAKLNIDWKKIELDAEKKGKGFDDSITIEEMNFDE